MNCVTRLGPAQPDTDDAVCYGTRQNGMESACVSYRPPTIQIETFGTAHVAEQAALKKRKECECCTREAGVAQVGEQCQGLAYLEKCVAALQRNREEGGVIAAGSSMVCARCRSVHRKLMTKKSAKARSVELKKMDITHYDNARFSKKLRSHGVPGVEYRKVHPWFCDSVPMCGLCEALVVTPWSNGALHSLKLPDGGDFVDRVELRAVVEETAFTKVGLRDLREYGRQEIVAAMKRLQETDPTINAVRAVNICGICVDAILKSVVDALALTLSGNSGTQWEPNGSKGSGNKFVKMHEKQLHVLMKKFRAPERHVVPMQIDSLWTQTERDDFLAGYSLPNKRPIRLVFLWTRTSHLSWISIPSYVYDFDLTAHLARKRYSQSKALVFPGSDDQDAEARTYDCFIVPDVYGKRGSYQSSLMYALITKSEGGSKLVENNIRPTFADLVSDVNLALATLHPATKVSILMDSVADLTGNSINLLSALRTFAKPQRTFLIAKRTTVRSAVREVATASVADVIFILENRIDPARMSSFVIPKSYEPYDLGTAAFFVSALIYELFKPLRHSEMSAGDKSTLKNRKILADAHESISDYESIPSQRAPNADELSLNSQPHSDEGLEQVADDAPRLRSSKPSKTFLCSWRKPCLQRLEVNEVTPREYFTNDTLASVRRRCEIKWTNRPTKKRTRETDAKAGEDREDREDRATKRARPVARSLSPSSFLGNYGKAVGGLVQVDTDNTGDAEQGVGAESDPVNAITWEDWDDWAEVPDPTVEAKRRIGYAP